MVARQIIAINALSTKFLVYIFINIYSHIFHNAITDTCTRLTTVFIPHNITVFSAETIHSGLSLNR